MDKAQLIISYFEKTLTEKEQLIFENYLENDKDFADEVAFEENVKKAIMLNERSFLKQKLKSFEKEKNSKKSIFIWYVAASILMVFGGGFWFINQSSNTEKLYTEYYQTYPNTILPSVRGIQSQDLKSNAFVAYDNENYATSFELFSKLYETTKDDYALFYSSMSLIELQKHKEAIVVLNKFDLNKENQFSPLVKWYKALCFLKLDQKEEAIKLLLSLASNQNSQQEMAKKLLEKLE